jgi:hypothetical protein
MVKKRKDSVELQSTASAKDSWKVATIKKAVRQEIEMEEHFALQECGV